MMDERGRVDLRGRPQSWMMLQVKYGCTSWVVLSQVDNVAML